MAFRFPVNYGGGLTAMIGSYQRERELQMRDAYTQMALDEMLRRRADETAARGVIPKMLESGGPSLTTLTAGAVPPSATTTDAPQPAEGESGLLGNRPSVTTATPGLPAATDTFAAPPTIRSLTQAVGGGENMAAVLRTREGQTALRTIQPVSDQELERQRQTRQAKLEARQFMVQAQQKREAGDEIGALGAEAAAYRAIYPVSDQPERTLGAIRDVNERITKARQAGPELADDTKEYAKRLSAFAADPSDPTAIGNLVGWAPKTAHVQDQLARVMPGLVSAIEKSAASKQVKVIEAEYIALTTDAARAGKPVSSAEAWRQAMQKHPKEAGAFFEYVVSRPKGTLPQGLMEAVVGDVGFNPTSDEGRVALMNVKARGLDVTTPPGAAALRDEMTRMRQQEKGIDPEMQRLKREKLEKEITDIETRTGQRTGAKPMSEKDKTTLLMNVERVEAAIANPLAGYTAEEKAARLARVEALRGKIQKMTAGGPPTPKPGTPASSTDTPERVQQKVAIDTAVIRLFGAGKVWTELTPQEKQRVVDDLNKGH